jgi:hypothetical protein
MFQPPVQSGINRVFLEKLMVVLLVKKFRLLFNLKFHYRVQTSPPLDPTHLGAVDILTP